MDGNGRRLKSTLRSFDPNTSQWTTEKVTYYVHSSVIGEVISEVSAQGAKERSFIFAGGKVMAIQTTSVGQAVSWEHYDATGASYRPTNSQGQPGIGKEMDPMGANAGTMKPLTWPQPTSPGKLEPYYGIPELNSAYDGCEVDGVPMICEEAAHLEKIGAGKVTVVNPIDPSRGGRRRPMWARKDTSYATSDLETNTVTVYSGPGGQFIWVEEPGAALETFLQQRPQVSAEERAASRAAELLNNTRCSNFMTELLYYASGFAAKPFERTPTSRFDHPIATMTATQRSYDFEPAEILQTYNAARTQGRVTASGESGRRGDSVTYGVTRNHDTIRWNREFYALGLDDQALHTLHESLHLYANCRP